MDRNTVFTKTAKGITQVNQKSASLSKDLMKVLKLIDGKSNFGQILEKAELDKPVLEKALNTLQKDGFARIFETRKEEVDPFAARTISTSPRPASCPGQTQRVIAARGQRHQRARRASRTRATPPRSRWRRRRTRRARRPRRKPRSRAKLEADARAKAEAEQRAMEQARKAKEASERAKAEVEAKSARRRSARPRSPRSRRRKPPSGR